MLDSSRLKAGTLEMKFQETRLDTLLRDVILRTTSFHENLTIDLKIDSPGVKISADPTRLAQVFENIILNAQKYAPDSLISIFLNTKPDQICIAIKDKGPGIPAEHIDKIFQRFYRVPNQNNTARGSGLGLYICHKIIESHNGEIRAESTPGRGTTFYICLPSDVQKPNENNSGGS